jgi:hypothetical protein
VKYLSRVFYIPANGKISIKITTKINFSEIYFNAITFRDYCNGFSFKAIIPLDCWENRIDNRLFSEESRQMINILNKQKLGPRIHGEIIRNRKFEVIPAKVENDIFRLDNGKSNEEKYKIDGLIGPKSVIRISFY